MSLLSFRGVQKCYLDGSQRHVVLDDVSFEIEAGDFVGVWGPRHSGKSTLLRIAAGIETTDAGKVYFGGMDVTSLSTDERVPALRDEIGFASASGPTYRNRSAGEHVALAALADGRTTLQHAYAMARRVLQRVDVLECVDRQLSALSMGERVRVEIARALVRSPRLLVVDEPPPLHNPREGDSLYDLLGSLGDEPDQTLLVACSDVTLVQRAHRMMALSRGRLTMMHEPAHATIHHLRSPCTGTPPA